MSKLWKGPSAEVTAALGDSLANRLHRRAGRQNIFYNITHDGRTAEVFRIERQGAGRYSFVPLGTAHGDDPLDTFLDAAFSFTPFDTELVDLASELIERRVTALSPAFAAVEKRVNAILSDLGVLLT